MAQLTRTNLKGRSLAELIIGYNIEPRSSVFDASLEPLMKKLKKRRGLRLMVHLDVTHETFVGLTFDSGAQLRMPQPPIWNTEADQCACRY